MYFLISETLRGVYISRMAVQTEKHFANKFYSDVRRCMLSNEDENEEITFQVIAICRYLRDTSFTHSLSHINHFSSSSNDNLQLHIISNGSSEGDRIDTDIYDMVLTNGKFSTRCLLSPACNYLIKTNKLTAGCTILVKLGDCRACNSETAFSDAITVVIKSLSILDRENSRSINTSGADCARYMSSLLVDRPLFTSRGCYLHLWNSDDLFCSSVFKKHASVVKSISVIDVKSIELSKLNRSWKSMPRPYPPLLLRVLHRARINNYGHPNKDVKWPFQFHVTAADQSGAVTVVFWNRLFRDVYDSLPNGTVFLLSNYAVKPERYGLLSEPAIRHLDLPVIDIEIDVNHASHTGEISVVEPSSVKPSWQLPALLYSFYTRRQISSLPNNFIVDIIGVVTHVGRYQRQRKSDESSEFWLSRWIELSDGTSAMPIRLHAYASSQICLLSDDLILPVNPIIVVVHPDVHDKILPGRTVIVTQCRVATRCGPNSIANRAIHVTTTNESQFFVVEFNTLSTTVVNDPVVKQLQIWQQSKTGRDVIQKSCTVAGRYTHPAVLRNFNDYLGTFPAARQMQLVDSCTLKKLVESLSFREYCRVHFKGVIAEVEWCNTSGVQTAEEPASNRDEREASPPSLMYQLRNRARALRGRNYGNLGRLLLNSGVAANAGSSSAKQTSSTRGRKRKSPDAEQSAATSQSCDSVVVDSGWSQLKSRIPILGSSVPHPSMVRRKFQQVRDEPVVKSNMLMPAAVHTGPTVACRRSLKDLSPAARDSNNELAVVTILGVNDNIAIKAFLSCEDLGRSDDPVTTSAVPNRTSTGKAKKSTTQLCAKLQSQLTAAIMGSSDSNHIWSVEDVRSLEREQTIFVLDVYSPGDDIVEVSLVHGFVIANS